MNTTWMLLIILIALYISVCWYKIYKAASTKWIPKWAWAIVVCISIPLGGMIYLLFGENREY
ncbi:PLDc N-terminal domain-containing protein [Pediococcus pentosaceus]|uniref:PenH n=1 Tax=Pediococcus pentosaceus TaxID=1255 RepID=Q9X3B7_PEDPE|nr:PLDc N-terminal domain-containing protein [Pediococcus pentosaceus]AAD25903.1 PenH [Pediococcus pentosaceus]AAF22860.1 yxlE-like protein [Pediococcus pentosaceus]MBF7126196.1 PLDc N-terminal domain-containing protein [Pediococcus pentosaceus]